MSIYRYRAEHEKQKEQLGALWPQSIWTEFDPREVAVAFTVLGVGAFLFSLMADFGVPSCSDTGRLCGTQRYLYPFLLILGALWWVYKRLYWRALSPALARKWQERVAALKTQTEEEADTSSRT